VRARSSNVTDVTDKSITARRGGPEGRPSGDGSRRAGLTRAYFRTHRPGSVSGPFPDAGGRWRPRNDRGGIVGSESPTCRCPGHGRYEFPVADTAIQGPAAFGDYGKLFQRGAAREAWTRAIRRRGVGPRSKRGTALGPFALWERRPQAGGGTQVDELTPGGPGPYRSCTFECSTSGCNGPEEELGRASLRLRIHGRRLDLGLPASRETRDRQSEGPRAGRVRRGIFWDAPTGMEYSRNGLDAEDLS